MIFTKLGIHGAWLIEPEKIEDSRGFFARSFCRQEFAKRGLNPDVVQCNISFNKLKGTLRGLHFQAVPKEEAKLVRCTSGAIYDVMLDLRSGQDTFLKWESFELTAENKKALYIPEGVAHGFQTLEDDTEVFYQMSEFYDPASSRGVLYNDTAFNISWPVANPVISDKDMSYTPFTP